MANDLNSNVRFYRLETLPSFDKNKHKGIFVHVTGTMFKRKWGISDGKGGYIEKDPATIYMTPEKVGESVERINLVNWLSTRHITEIASGLWFGGVNGWELLSNDTNSIDATINAKIAALNAGGFTQATIGANNTEGSESATGSTLTIKGIKEFQGKIAQDDTKNFVVAIDGVYDETDNKIATQDTVTNTINGLNVDTIQAVTFNTPENGGNTTLTFKGVKEVNGKIAEGTGATTFIVGDAKLKIQIGSSTATDVFSANAQADSTIQLDGLVFKKNGDVISVITPTAVASDNRLVTEKDVANLAGAMHYKGTVSSLQEFTNIINNTDSDSDAEEAGNVYIATGNFTHGNNDISTGDMIVFNGPNNYNVIQSNITLGIKSGQIAKNDGDLVNGNLVVATGTGIKTTNISASVLEGTNSNRDLAYGNITGGVSIKDSLTVLGKDLEKTINISSTNRSIEIAANASENATGVVVDLVWNTTME